MKKLVSWSDLFVQGRTVFRQGHLGLIFVGWC